LQRDRVNILLASNAADNAARRRLTGRALNGSGGTGDEGNVCAFLSRHLLTIARIRDLFV
jgi:hypothetical protein